MNPLDDEPEVRRIPCDELYRMRPDALAAAVERDRLEGLAPFMAVASAGTTNTGAVDPLGELADLAAREGLWLHVDAAYGGFFLLTERGRAAMAGIERADSVTLDPHKGLFLPYGTGCLLVRRQADLREAHCVHADYMPPPREEDDVEQPDFCEISPELSRDFRGLRVWLPLAMHGAGTFRRYLDEKLDLARWAADELRELEHVEIVAEPQLSLLAFRYAPPGVEPEEQDRLNQAILDRVNAGRRVYLTATRLDGRFVPRICVLHFRTHRDRVAECLDAIREALREVAGGS